MNTTRSTDPYITLAFHRWTVGARREQSAVWYRAMATRLHIAATVTGGRATRDAACAASWRADEAA